MYFFVDKKAAKTVKQTVINCRLIMSHKFVNCVTLWGAVLEKNCSFKSSDNNLNKNPFNSLLHPFSSLICAVLEHYVSPNDFPFRLKILSVALSLLKAVNGELYIPLLAHIFPLLKIYSRKNPKAAVTTGAVDINTELTIKNKGAE